MPLYFFDSRDGVAFLEDDTGTECADHDEACNEAMRGLADLAQQYLPTLGPNQRLEMTVRTDRGISVLHLDLRLTVTRVSELE
jgi:hypothetical protein